MEAFYYLDTGEIQCLVVPDEFNRGYQSVAELSDSLRRFMKKPERNTVSYSTVRRETLFSKRKSRSFVHYESVRRIEYMRIITEVEE